MVLILGAGCTRLGGVARSVSEERIIKDSTGRYKVIVCPHCGKQIKIPF